MKITITIHCDNAAFDGAPEVEVSRILTDLSERCVDRGIKALDGSMIRDINGNPVGHFLCTGRAS